MEILPNGSHISIVLWFCLFDFSKMPREKGGWKVNKDATGCFEENLEATPNKTAVWPLTSNLTNHPSTIC